MRKLLESILPSFLFLGLRRFYKGRKKKKLLKSKIGDNVFCPICRFSSVEFGEFGVVSRKGARCYNCKSLERHRLLYLFLKNETNLLDNVEVPLKVLHFAPETFFYKIFSSNSYLDYHPCDLFPELYSLEYNVLIDRVNIIDIPFIDSSFDFILCNHVLEHVTDDLKAMSELFRVMARGGSGIFQVPVDYSRLNTYEDFRIVKPIDRENAFGQKDHVRWYGRDYKERLEKAGFKVLVIDYVSNFEPNEILKFGLDKSELIYYCTKE